MQPTYDSSVFDLQSRMPLGRRKRSLVQCWDGEHRLTGWSLTSVQIMENSVQERRGTLLVRLVSNFSSKGWKILYKFVTGLPRWSYVGQSLSLGERSEEARLPFRKSIFFKSCPICIIKHGQSCWQQLAVMYNNVQTACPDLSNKLILGIHLRGFRPPGVH